MGASAREIAVRTALMAFSVRLIIQNGFLLVKGV
jgi:hypothetical protein